MRKSLQQKSGERRRFHAIFSKYGKKPGYHDYAEETILLTDVKDWTSGELVADHLWFTLTKGFREVGLIKGQRIAFDARIKKYMKGYVNQKYKINQRTSDYKLSHPTRIAAIRIESKDTPQSLG